MTRTVSYTEARLKLASILDEAADTREPVIIARRGKTSVALIDVEELESMQEIVHLMKSPANARALATSIEEAWEGKAVKMTLSELEQRAKQRAKV